MNKTEAYQRSFAAYIRSPDKYPLPTGLNSQRMGVYTELLLNNIQDLLTRTFPITCSILNPTEWHGFIREFYAAHICQTPYFREIAAEFVQWFKEYFKQSSVKSRYPFLLELVHYEWITIPLLLDETEIEWPDLTKELASDYPHKVLRFNPVMLLQAYQYPVHIIRNTYLPLEIKYTYLLILRNRQYKVDFIELNAITAHLVQLLQSGLTLQQSVLKLSTEIQYIDQTQLLEYGLQLIRQLRSEDCIVT